MIAALLLGSTLVNIGGSAITTSVLVVLTGESGDVYATIIMTVLLLVFAEVLPKTLAIISPTAFRSPWRNLSLFVAVFGPLLAGVEYFVRPVLNARASSWDTDAPCYRPMMNRGRRRRVRREGNVERSARDMFGGVLDLQVLQVANVMIHRTKMRTIDADLPPEDLLREEHRLAIHAHAALARSTG